MIVTRILKSAWYRSRAIGRLLLPVPIPAGPPPQDDLRQQLADTERRAQQAEFIANEASNHLRLLREKIDEAYGKTNDKTAYIVLHWLRDVDHALNLGHGGSVYFIDDYLRRKIDNQKQTVASDEAVEALAQKIDPGAYLDESIVIGSMIGRQQSARSEARKRLSAIER